MKLTGSKDLFLILIFFIVYQQSNGQHHTSFHDSTWNIIAGDSAYFYCVYTKKEDLFLKECYWKSSNNLKSVSMQTGVSGGDRTIGLKVEYYEDKSYEKVSVFDEDGIKFSTYNYYRNGLISDSVFYSLNGKVDSAFHYFENGKTHAIYHAETSSGKSSLVVFNENSEPVMLLSYSEDPTFRKKDRDWFEYITSNMDPNEPMRHDAPPGKYTVIIKYTVDIDGSVINVEPETKLGYGMEKEVMKWIKRSPKWKPGHILGKPKQFVRRQPVTFVVPGKF